MLEEIYKIFKQSKGITTDTRNLEEDQLFVALKGENFNGNLYAQQALDKGALAVIVDEEIDELSHLDKVYKVDDSLNFFQSLAHYHRMQLKIPFIGLTGSNGKTTTKELIATALSPKYKVAYTQGNLNNHIGVPLTLLSIDESHEIAVIEMGANHLKEIEELCAIVNPTHGYITNFGKAHLEGFGGLEGVVKTKTELYESLKHNEGLAFINADDEVQVEKIEGVKNIKFSFHSKNVEYNFETVEGFENAALLYNHTSLKSQLTGQYNVVNMAAAVSIALFFGVSIEDIKQVIEAYEPKLNRSQLIKLGDMTMIMDAYNANPTSMEAALINLSQKNGKKVAVLGDMFELGNYSSEEHQKIASMAESLNIDEVYLIGKNFYKTQVNKAEKFLTLNDFQNYLEKNKINNGIILIKGSRGMKLETILFKA